MSDVLTVVLDDLATESARLESLVADLPDAAWRLPTPAPGWDVATQIAHLAWTDEAARTAATDKQGWDALVLEALADPEHSVDRAALTGGIAAPPVLLERWRTARARLAETLRTYPTGARIPWYGPPMSAASMATVSASTARSGATPLRCSSARRALGPRPRSRCRVTTKASA